MSMRTETKIQAYVAAEREVRRLMALPAPPEECVAERARLLKEANALAASWYRQLSGGALGKARRLLALQPLKEAK